MSAIENINQDELTLHQQDQIAAEIGTKSEFITLGWKIVSYSYIQEELCIGVSEKKLRLDQ
jgi:hypothetical protein